MNGHVKDLKVIETQRGEMISLLTRLADINSSSTNPQGLEICKRLLIEEFACLGATLEIVSLKPTKYFDDRGLQQQLEHGDVLRFVKKRLRKKHLLLVGHYDTVHPQDSHFQKCTLKEDDDLLIGPGTLDMKGGLVVMLYALKFLESTPLARELSWEIVLVPDEEIGSPASTPILTASAKKAHVGLVFEPALEDGNLASSRKGSANFSVICKGKAAHAGRNPGDGINAICALAGVVNYLETLRGDDYYVNVGSITGGGKLNVVPDFAKMGFNLRFNTIKDFKKAELLIEIQKTFVKKSTRAELELEMETFRPPKVFDPTTRTLFEKLGACAKALNLPISWRPVGGVCDGNTLAGMNVPTIDTLGVVGSGIHTDKECVFLESLTERAKLTALLLMTLAEEK
ncbi:MAG: hydrolase [Chlamydiia bacterium]|nr:hydrolase [Chlamydiia bacterium]